MCMATKLDIFDTLRRIDKKERLYISELSPEDRKGFVPLVVMRWMSGTSNALQINLLNQLVNKYVFSLYKHPDLLWKLMTICTGGKVQKYKWIKQSNQSTTFLESIKVIKAYFNYNDKHAKQALRTIDKSVIPDMARELGYTNEEVNKILLELGLIIKKSKK